MAAVVIGGGARQGRWSDAFVQLLSLAPLVVLAFGATRYDWRNADRFAITVLSAVVLLPLVQLIPLPPSLWTALPGRETFALAYAAAGMDVPWMPISLDPAATWRSWLGLLPAVTVFMTCLVLDYRERRKLSLLLIGLGMGTVLLGLAQMAQGPESALRLYPFTNATSSVGFFANRNHHATLLTILIPLVAAWAVGSVGDRRGNRLFAVAVCLIVFAVLILGVAMAGSRAGVALASLAAIGSFFLIPASGRRLSGYAFIALAAAAAVGVILAVNFAFIRILGRFEADILADLRFTIAEVTASAVWTYFPFGSGFGTFEEIYRIFEPTEALLSAYVNHAHNDWLESVLEGGILSIAVMVAFVVWFAGRSYRAWRAPAIDGQTVDGALARAATIALLLLLLFSLVEYPLRTTTLSVIFAWLAALVIEPLPGRDRREATGSARPSHRHRHHAHPRRRPGSFRPNHVRG